MKQKIIINADDFGKSHSINAAIAECFSKGYISSTTLMVNMPYADEAVNIAFQNGFSDKVGLHLNLTEGRYLSKRIESPCLAEGDRFNGLFHSKTMTRLVLPREAVREIYREIQHQMNKYLSYGLTNMHIDSHHHVHTDLPVYIALKNLFAEYKFRSLRIGRNLIAGGVFFSPLFIYKRVLNNRIRQLSPYITDYFGSFDDYLNVWEIPNIRCKNIELMCHPGYDEDGRLVNNYVDRTASVDIAKFYEMIGSPEIISY